MAEIHFKSGRIGRFDDADAELLSRFTWWEITNHKPNRSKHYILGYPKTDSRAPRTMMHRVLLKPSSRLWCDHINGDGLDNRRSNLRLCTRSENSMNQWRCYGAVDFKGVTRHHDGRFRARIRVNGKNIHLGCFLTAEDAALAYDAAAPRFYGEFALTNEDMGKFEENLEMEI